MLNVSYTQLKLPHLFGRVISDLSWVPCFSNSADPFRVLFFMLLVHHTAKPKLIAPIATILHAKATCGTIFCKTLYLTGREHEKKQQREFVRGATFFSSCEEFLSKAEWIPLHVPCPHPTWGKIHSLQRSKSKGIDMPGMFGQVAQENYAYMAQACKSE